MATATRTLVVLVFAWAIAFLSGAWRGISRVSGRSLLFLVLSGLSTGASRICCFRALQPGDVGKVAAVDKSRTILAMGMAVLFLGEPMTWAGAAAMAVMKGGDGFDGGGKWKNDRARFGRG